MKTETPVDQAAELDQALGADVEIVPIHVSETETRDVAIRPIRLKQFSEVLKCINDLAAFGLSLDGQFDAVQLLSHGGPVVMKLMVIASGESIDTIEQLELDEAAELAGAIYRVNRSFFEKKAETMLAAFGLSPEQVAQLKSSLVGLTSSVSSPATATE